MITRLKDPYMKHFLRPYRSTILAEMTGEIHSISYGRKLKERKSLTGSDDSNSVDTSGETSLLGVTVSCLSEKNRTVS